MPVSILFFTEHKHCSFSTKNKCKSVSAIQTFTGDHYGTDCPGKVFLKNSSRSICELHYLSYLNNMSWLICPGDTLKAARDLLGRKKGLSTKCLFYQLDKYSRTTLTNSDTFLLSMQEVNLESIFPVRTVRVITFKSLDGVPHVSHFHPFSVGRRMGASGGKTPGRCSSVLSTILTV